MDVCFTILQIPQTNLAYILDVSYYRLIRNSPNKRLSVQYGKKTGFKRLPYSDQIVQHLQSLLSDNPGIVFKWKYSRALHRVKRYISKVPSYTLEEAQLLAHAIVPERYAVSTKKKNI